MTDDKNAGRAALIAAISVALAAAARVENNRRKRRERYRTAHGIPLELEKLKPWEYASKTNGKKI